MTGEQKHFESLYPESAFSDEIEKLLGYIRGGHSCQALGLPGVGRSELLEFLAYNKKIRQRYLGENSKYVHFALIDFSEIRKRSLFDAMKFIFLGLADSLRDRGMTDEYQRVNESFREALGFNDELVLFQELKQVIDFLALEKKLTLIFLFNRFEEYIPSVSSEFFRNLRVLRDRAKYRFSVVFSVDRPLESLLDPMLLSDFYEYAAGNLVYIKYHDIAVIDFMIAYLERLTGKKLDAAIKDEVLRLTGGYARLSRLAIEVSLADTEIDQKNLMDFLLSQKSIQAALMEIWLSLMPAEQSDITQKTFDDPVVDEYLEATGLINDKKIRIPLFESFTNSSNVLIKGGKEEIEYDENTNSIRRGKAVLSDSLTSSEFRLLKYLLQNSERVVDRDEIIAIVWHGLRSTAGITDQAVDQLIFRLRRKIEEDPNKPAHIQTVKGRGFKFSS